MAIPCLHEAITRSAMADAGFNEPARDRAAHQNALVDERQGNSAGEANLHSMCGFLVEDDLITGRPLLTLQTPQECQEAVNALLEEAKADIVEAVSQGDTTRALNRLGQALHTVQDRAFHNFEPWPFRGITDAVLNDPNYMVCHALRDLGAISRLDLTEVHRGRFDVELTMRLGGPVFLSGRFFTNPARFDRAPIPTGRDSMFDSGFLGTGGMLTLTIGAPPGSLPARQRPDVPDFLPTGPSPMWDTIALQGPAARTRAEDASARFIQEVRQQFVRASTTGEQAWTNFLQYRQAQQNRPMSGQH